MQLSTGEPTFVSLSPLAGDLSACLLWDRPSTPLPFLDDSPPRIRCNLDLEEDEVSLGGFFIYFFEIVGYFKALNLTCLAVLFSNLWEFGTECFKWVFKDSPIHEGADGEKQQEASWRDKEWHQGKEVTQINKTNKDIGRQQCEAITANGKVKYGVHKFVQWNESSCNQLTLLGCCISM